jgi:GLPGLI family protein
MKSVTLLILFICIALNIFSQNIQGSIEYKMEFYGPPSMKATLHFSGDESCFVSNKFYSREERTFYNERKSVLPRILVGDTIGKIVYKNLSERKTILRPFIGINALVVNDTLSEINWELSEVTRMIGNYKCQKATTKFKGREYEVWFTPEIPISTGPWQLWGLPGLILEGKDKTEQVIFNFLSLKIGKIDILKTRFPQNLDRPWLLGKAVNKEKYIRLLNEFRKHSIESDNALLAEGDTRIVSYDEWEWIEEAEKEKKNDK